MIKSRLSVGDKIGMLTLLEKLPTRTMGDRGQYKKRFWFCQCDCGNTKEISANSLVSGNVKSCGCYKKDRKNAYQLKPQGIANARALFWRYKDRAIKRGYKFDLEFDDFLKITQGNCYYCGRQPSSVVSPKYTKGEKQGKERSNGPYIYNGIDRKNNLGGYTLDNSVPACGQCNLAKGKMDIDEFLAHVFSIHNHQSRPDR